MNECFDADIVFDSNVFEVDVCFDEGVGGVSDYEKLKNLPSIEGHTLIGDSLLPEIGVNIITEQSIDSLIYGQG